MELGVRPRTVPLSRRCHPCLRIHARVVLCIDTGLEVGHGSTMRHSNSALSACWASGCASRNAASTTQGLTSASSGIIGHIHDDPEPHLTNPQPLYINTPPAEKFYKLQPHDPNSQDQLGSDHFNLPISLMGTSKIVASHASFLCPHSPVPAE